MKLSTGKVAFTFEYDNGDSAVVYINPNDKGLQGRIREFEKKVEEKAKKIDFEKLRSKYGDEGIDIAIDNPAQLMNASPAELEKIQKRLDVISEIEKEYDHIVADELDEVFQTKISDVAFRYCAPFDVVVVPNDSGETTRELYVVHFLRSFAEEISQYGMENNKAVEKHLSKYSR